MLNARNCLWKLWPRRCPRALWSHIPRETSPQRSRWVLVDIIGRETGLTIFSATRAGGSSSEKVTTRHCVVLHNGGIPRRRVGSRQSAQVLPAAGRAHVSRASLSSMCSPRKLMHQKTKNNSCVARNRLYYRIMALLLFLAWQDVTGLPGCTCYIYMHLIDTERGCLASLVQRALPGLQGGAMSHRICIPNLCIS